MSLGTLQTSQYLTILWKPSPIFWISHRERVSLLSTLRSILTRTPGSTTLIDTISSVSASVTTPTTQLLLVSMHVPTHKYVALWLTPSQLQTLSHRTASSISRDSSLSRELRRFTSTQCSHLT